MIKLKDDVKAGMRAEAGAAVSGMHVEKVGLQRETDTGEKQETVWPGTETSSRDNN